jgi:phage-related protein
VSHINSIVSHVDSTVGHVDSTVSHVWNVHDAISNNFCKLSKY